MVILDEVKRRLSELAPEVTDPVSYTHLAWQSTKDCQAFFAHCTSKTAGPKRRSTLETGIFDAEQGKLPQAPVVVVKAI